MARGSKLGTTGDESPLRPIDFAVLTVLAEGEAYGYAIVRAVAERDAGGIRLAPGNLYQVLDRVIERGWITESRRRATRPNERRRFYRRTAQGRAVAAAEARRLAAMMPQLQRLRLVAKEDA